MEAKLEVLILCSNRLLGESVAHILKKRPDFKVISSQGVGPCFREEITNSTADVLVLDSLQHIVENPQCLPKSLMDKSSIKCVLVAMKDDHSDFLRAVRRGVLGYVLQDACANDVVAAIRAVAHGDPICPPRFSRLLFDQVASQLSDLPSGKTREHLGLTRREQQLVPLIGRGLTNKEIANHLNLSEQTVKSHIHRILGKVGVEDRLSIFESFQNQTLGL